MMCSKTSSGSVSSESMIEVGLQVKASDVPEVTVNKVIDRQILRSMVNKLTVSCKLSFQVDHRSHMIM